MNVNPLFETVSEPPGESRELDLMGGLIREQSCFSVTVTPPARGNIHHRNDTETGGSSRLIPHA